MPLITEELKTSIVSALGYPFDSAILFDVLSTDLPLLVIDKITFYLDEIDRLNISLVGSFENLSIKKVEDLEFFPSKDVDIMMSGDMEKRKNINQLSDLLSIPLAYGYRHEIRYQ